MSTLTVKFVGDFPDSADDQGALFHAMKPATDTFFAALTELGLTMKKDVKVSRPRKSKAEGKSHERKAA